MRIRQPTYQAVVFPEPPVAVVHVHKIIDAVQPFEREPGGFKQLANALAREKPQVRPVQNAALGVFPLAAHDEPPDGREVRDVRNGRDDFAGGAQ